MVCHGGTLWNVLYAMVCMHVCMHAFMCACIYVCMRACKYVRLCTLRRGYLETAWFQGIREQSDPKIRITSFGFQNDLRPIWSQIVARQSVANKNAKPRYCWAAQQGHWSGTTSSLRRCLATGCISLESPTRAWHGAWKLDASLMSWQLQWQLCCVIGYKPGSIAGCNIGALQLTRCLSRC